MVLTADRSGERADAALARLAPDLTRSAAQRLLEEGRVLREGRPLRKKRQAPGRGCAGPGPAGAPARGLGAGRHSSGYRL